MYNSAKTAEKIKVILKDKGITVKRLGEMVDNDSNIISKIGRGELKKVDLFCVIAHVLNVSLDDIIDNSKPYELK